MVGTQDFLPAERIQVCMTSHLYTIFIAQKTNMLLNHNSNS